MHEATPQAVAAEASRVWPARAAAVVLVLLGFLPLAAWLPGGLEVPNLELQLRDWGTGSLLTLGVGALAWMLSRRHHWPSDVLVRRGMMRGGPMHGGLARSSAPAAPVHTGALAVRIYLVALCALLLYALVAATV